MPPDSYSATGPYHDARDNRLKAWHVDSQEQEAKRQHPQTENRKQRQKTASDEHAGNRDPKLPKASVQE